MKKRTVIKVSKLSIMVSFGFLLGCDTSESQDFDAESSEDAIEVEKLEKILKSEIEERVIARLELDGGTILKFMSLPQSEGDDGVGLFEEGPIGAPVYEDLAILQNATMYEIFWALSEPGDPVPKQILATGSSLRSAGEQGWGLDEIVEISATRWEQEGSCDSDTYFKSKIDNKNFDVAKKRMNQRTESSNYFIRNDSFLPGSDRLWELWDYSPNGSDTGSIVYNVDSYYSRVQLCDFSIPVINGKTHGPRVRFSYRDANNNGWFLSQSTQIDSYWRLSWTWDNSNNNYDWKTEINQSADINLWDIGHTWDN